MGSIAAMNHLERLLDLKQDELKVIASRLIADDSFPSGVSIEPEVKMNELFAGVDIIWNVTMKHPESGDTLNFSLPGPMMDFDFLADEFPDLEMGR